MMTGVKVDAGYVFSHGKIINADFTPTLSAEGHFLAGTDALDCQRWKEAVKHFKLVIRHFQNCPFAQDSYFYLGVAYYHLDEYDLANYELSNYLKFQNNPLLFEDAMQYKFAIAEAFRCGAKRRFFTSKRFPKWISAKDLALEMYDEVIIALPNQDLAADALYSKGWLLRSLQDYRESVETFQILIRRFPKHELAPESYLLINEIYLEQARWEFQNPDIIALAQINLRRFKQEFPREERIIQAEELVLCIKEVYAKGLYDSGQYYERKCHPRAAVIYYENAVRLFPETCIADLCRERLSVLQAG